MFDNVVVGVDDREIGRDVLALARQLAACDAEFTLVYVNVVHGKPAPDSASKRDASIERFARERLGMLRDQVGMAAHVSSVEAPSPRHGLHAFATSHEADLLVIGATRHDDISRLLIGDDTREVLEDPPCAVAVAPIGYAAHAADIDEIGVAYDSSPGSDEALAVARHLADRYHATLSVFEAVTPPVYARDIYDVEGQIEDEVTEARERSAALGDVESQAVAADHTVEALRRYEPTVDLLVIGPHKYTPIDRLLEHTISQRLADNAPRPLLVLSSAARSSRRAAK
ncbi:MAG TPA: universal stress protein [Solirubrobacteraceae bacterium]|nr:universal stress protein [Solirubrobacteraceae bacterium]